MVAALYARFTYGKLWGLKNLAPPPIAPPIFPPDRHAYRKKHVSDALVNYGISFGSMYLAYLLLILCIRGGGGGRWLRV